jgi:outer membrane protein assembly factor BamB
MEAKATVSYSRRCGIVLEPTIHNASLFTAGETSWAMQLRTTVAAVLVVSVLAGTAAIGFSTIADSGGTLTERWVSDTSRPNQANHHPVAAKRIDGRTFIAAPVSSVAGTGTEKCALVMLDANGTIRWRQRIANRACAIHGIGDPTIADFNGDGVPDVLAPTTENVLYGYNAYTGERELRVNLTAFGYSNPVVLSSPTRTIVAVDFNGTVFSIQPNGTVAWRRHVAAGVTAETAKGDFDRDGKPEAVVGAAGNVTLFEPNGTVDWQTPVSATFVVTGKVAGNQTIFVANSTDIVRLDGATGTIRWRWRTANNRPAIHALGDGDEDGTNELYVTTGGGNLYALSARTGTVEWHTTLSAQGNIVPAPVLGDVDGDGHPELVTVTNSGIVSVRNPKTGELLASYQREVAIWTHPTLVDLDGDRAQEILVMYGDGRVVALSYTE